MGRRQGISMGRLSGTRFESAYHLSSENDETDKGDGGCEHPRNDVVTGTADDEGPGKASLFRRRWLMILIAGQAYIQARPAYTENPMTLRMMRTLNAVLVCGRLMCVQLR